MGLANAGMRDHDGSILVMIDAGDPTPVPLVYMHRRLSVRAAHGTTCEGCNYTYNKREPYPRTPMYESFALHQIDGFGDWLNWCQPCMDSAADGDAGDVYTSQWYTGRYGNAPALLLTDEPKHRLDRV